MPKEPRSETIIFRLRKSHMEELKKQHRRIKITDVKTVNQFVRKLAVDFSEGRLAYANLDDQSRSV